MFVSSVWGMGVIASAVVLDMVLGDAEHLPHPVRFIGSLVSRSEAVCRKLPVDEMVQGAVLVLVVLSVTASAVALLLKAAFALWTPAAWLISVLVIYFSISLKCLEDEALAVKEALETQGIEAARMQVSRIVGRDTSQLSEAGVCMATIETVAENFVDGVVAPLFYAAVGGPVLCAVYRAANVMDAMVGYRNEKYIKFGRCAARLDDLANWLPARLSVVAICAASRLTGIGKRKEIRRVVRQDSRSHSSPNSGFPESAFAAALGVRIGGPATYQGVVTEYPWINQGKREPELHDIDRAVRLLRYSALVLYAFVLSAGVLLLLLT